MKEESIQKRLEKRFRRIALREGLTYQETIKIFRAQFGFTVETIEALSREDIESKSEEEINKLVFNYLYLGKIHSSTKLQKHGRERNEKKQRENGSRYKFNTNK